MNRTVAMMNKYFDGAIPVASDALEVTEFDSQLEAYVNAELEGYHTAMENLAFNQALDHVMKIVSRANKYIDETAPWVLIKEEASKPQLKSVMNHLADVLRLSAHLLRPFMTSAPQQIFDQLGLENEADRDLQTLAWGQIEGQPNVIKKGVPIFPRLDTEVEIQYIHDLMAVDNQADEDAEDSNSVDDPNWDPANVELVHYETAAIEFDDFIKVEMKVAEVIDVKPVEGSNKLLRFRLDAGDKGHRQILSGIAKYYPDHEALIGKKVTIVANLKPRKMMGHVSQGMILSAESDGQLSLVFAPEDAANGALLG